MALSDNLVEVFPMTENNLPYTGTVGGYILAASNAAYQGTSPGPAWHLTSGAGTLTVDSISALSAAPMTLAIQVYIPTGSAAGDYCFVGRGLGDTDYFELLQNNGSTPIIARTRGSGGISDTAGSASISGNTWYNCAAVFASSTSRKVYLDGTLGSAETTSNTPSGSQNRISILSLKRSGDTVNVCPTTYYAKWCAVWSRALSQSELDDYFSNPGQLLPATPPPNQEGSIVELFTTRNRPGRGPYSRGALFRPRIDAYVAPVMAGLTGQSATASSGTLAPASTVALTGSAAAASAGTLAPSTTIALTGSAVAASAGTLVPSKTVPLTGAAASASAGTLSPSSSVPLAGSAATASAGTLTPSTTIGLVGTAVTVSAGTLTASAGSNVTAALSGSAVAASAGTLGLGTTAALSGGAATISTGTLGAAIQVAVVGAAATASAGTLAPGRTIALSGQQITISAGTLTPSSGGNVTVALVGSAVIVTAGRLHAHRRGTFSVSPAVPGEASDFVVTPEDSPVTQGLPGDWLQFREEGVDVGDANVEVWDIVGDPSKVLATRGVGENSHIITIWMDPTSVPTCLPLFLDNFDGAVGGNVAAHTPDIAPVGFSWITSTAPLILDGAGLAQIGTGNSLGIVRAPFTGVTPMPVGSAYVLSLSGRMPG